MRRLRKGHGCKNESDIYHGIKYESYGKLLYCSGYCAAILFTKTVENIFLFALECRIFPSALSFFIIQRL